MARHPIPRHMLPVLLLLLLYLLPPLSRAGDPRPTGGRLRNSCIKARRKCQADPTCNAAYHHLISCTSSISTPSPAGEPSVSQDCLEAGQHLRNSSLMSCTCHWPVKNRATCLDIYRTVHPASSLGDYKLDVSRYKDTVTRKPRKTNLSKLSILKSDSDLCLKFATLCTVDAECDPLRKAYGKACSGPRCQRDTCLKELRAFFDKAPEHRAQGMLLCPCAPADRGCGQRRRNTIAPSCALPSETPNCLDLQAFCLSDPVCRSRLEAFQIHCHPMDILGTCTTEKSRCLQAYTGMIGTAMTPNFVSDSNASVALSCTCRGSGNRQQECEELEESFSHNPCLLEAMAAKMRFHSQYFSKDFTDSPLPMMEHQNKFGVVLRSPALRPHLWVPSLFSCTLTLILLPSFW